ncbi:MAG: hypothetical protein PHQ22_09630 [Sulfuricurvum sp.]|nr:hypothetical protein [Sulfuricurvum sp.]MDD5387439.1 hypothetical protein [Sulfuricurvum sp.]
MSQTLQIINIIVLIAAMWFGLHSLYKSDRERKKKKAQDDAETERWERGAEIASQDKEYMAFVNDFTGLGKEYDSHKWYFKIPDSAVKHLEACFEGDERKVYTMKRAIELSIEHFAIEMADDAECARIIEERVFRNPKPAETFDIEEYKQYRQEREEVEGEFESFTQWKGRKDKGEKND